MFGYLRKNILIKVGTTTSIINTKFKKLYKTKPESSGYLQLSDINPNRFLTTHTPIMYGNLAKKLKVDKPLTKKKLAKHEIYFYLVNQQFHLEPNNSNAFIWTDSENFELVDPKIYHYNVANKLPEQPNFNKLYYYLVITTNHFEAKQNIIDFVRKMSRSNESSKYHVIIMGFWSTTDLKWFLTQINSLFSKIYLFASAITLDMALSVIYLKYNKKAKTFSSADLTHAIELFHDEMNQTLAEASAEYQIMTTLASYSNMFDQIYDVCQLLILRNNIEIAKSVGLAINNFYVELLITLTYYVSKNYNNFLENISHTKHIKDLIIFDDYQLINQFDNNLIVDTGLKFLVDDLDLEIFDLCNSHFLLVDNIRYHCDEFFTNSIERYIQHYNLNIKHDQNNYHIYFLSNLDYALKINFQTNTKLVVRISLASLVTENHFVKQLFQSFEIYNVHVPLLNQLYNDYVYLIGDKWSIHPIGSHIEMPDIVTNYLIQNKIPLMYYKRLIGHEIIQKAYVEKFLEKI